jgi:hypothetical protein
MNDILSDREFTSSQSYEPPTLEVISLDCEISSYAPDEGDTPLF